MVRSRVRARGDEGQADAVVPLELESDGSQGTAKYKKIGTATVPSKGSSFHSEASRDNRGLADRADFAERCAGWRGVPRGL